MKTKILFEKIDRKYGESLPSWEKLYDDVDTLFQELVKHKNYLISKDYEIRIRVVEVFDKEYENGR